jgi:hypothetical protein
MMKNELFNEDKVLTGTANEVRKLKCPECGSGLKVNYYSNDKVKGACAECLNCDFIVRFCRLIKEPPWVSELGCEIET